VFKRAITWAAEIPGFGLPMMRSHQSPRLSKEFLLGSRIASVQIGAETSTGLPTSMPENPGSVTPTISKGWPLREIVCPTTSVRPA
jgi:hypothetical protein